jgi:hypothetical protein
MGVSYHTKVACEGVSAHAVKEAVEKGIDLLYKKWYYIISFRKKKLKTFLENKSHS